jgi:flagellar motility protein MotE (MotC chaperone)
MLVILALFLASSGALRLGAGFGQALARTEGVAPGDLADSASTEPLNCPKPPLALAEALNDREAKVILRENALADRQAALVLADQAIEARLAKLAKAEDELTKTLALADGAAENDLTRLTEVYQTMKPKDAAALFAAMAPEFAAGFLGRMRPDAAAAVLSGMTPEAAYTVSALLAGRNAKVPKQ